MCTCVPVSSALYRYPIANVVVVVVVLSWRTRPLTPPALAALKSSAGIGAFVWQNAQGGGGGASVGLWANGTYGRTVLQYCAAQDRTGLDWTVLTIVFIVWIGLDWRISATRLYCIYCCICV